ncbi:hypothetical protein [Streptomyces sp. RTd22]|uniref:hypothetical protein n=1 Tax=Streptomyces sp. RTd22 TaxID=1841249 RepID=UPI0007C4B852|nr:hypothetical protein [Streptomyces sp. RTd22]
MRPHSSWRPTRLALGGLTTLTAVSLAGVLGALPAAAQGLGAEPLPASTVMSTDQAFSLDSMDPMDPDPVVDPAADTAAGPGKPGKPKPPRPGANGCFDIDTVRQEAAGGGAFYAAVSFGVPYVGDEDTPGGVIDWDDLSDEPGDVPVGACGVSIDVGPGGPGSDIFIDVITTSGTVHGITCDRTGAVITSCGSWVQRETPTPGDTLGP